MSQNTPLLQHQQQFNFMETPQKQKEKAMDIGSLLSPPEATRTVDLFSSPVSVSMSRTPSQSTAMASSQSQGSTYAPMAKKDPRALPSPPISPHIYKDDMVRADEGTTDPPLFPPREDIENVNKGPLFPQDDEQAAIDEHIATHGRLCSQDEYRLVLDTLSNMKFNTSVGAGFNRNRAKWWATSLQTFAFYDEIKAKARREAATADAKKPPTSTLPHRRLAPAPEGGLRKKVTVPRVQRVPKPKRSPPQQVFNDFAMTAKETLPKAPKAPSNRDDVDFNSIQDFCPPTDNLGHNAKALKADWKGAMLDLSHDPDRHLLHEAEVNLAATLRLSCATYLTSKRRIFVARVQCMQKGKEFRKTDAQQACKIDVNKASKLWTAFEKVGWFDDKYFIGKRA
ncbi:uncharacterized protein PV09_09587 [Verruconis gallopava]|uniref:SWIRM domain-containing protein n=1 Tax=Verruconis gallopava TaxID=253628 RepID=A0A0D2AI99_9PEZI|nr:uncharacterized protein PV09_09587 [Verruconis gallopava]KIV98643.1 hypothetical protein PV09_09587 [Verruconis gallopava]